MKYVIIKLTKKEVGQLFSVADNGYGDGDFYEQMGQGRAHAAYRRAMEKLNKARYQATILRVRRSR